MNIRLMLLVFLVAIYGCMAVNKTDLKIPDVVETDKAVERIRMPGTKILCHKPSNYQFVKSLLRIQKSEHTFIQFFEMPNTNFNDKISDVKKDFEEKVKSGKMAALYYQKEFTLGAYKALLFYGPDNKPNLDQMLLVFGDSTFIVMATGELPVNDKVVRQEVLNELLEVTVDKSLRDDPEALKSFDLDLSGTDFKANSGMSQVFSYTVDGKGNPAQDPFLDNIMVITYPPIAASDFKERSLDMIKRWQQSGISINKSTEKSVLINGLPALEATIEGEFQGRKNKIYFLTTSNQKSGVMFIGITYAGTDKLFLQMQLVAQTLKIK